MAVKSSIGMAVGAALALTLAAGQAVAAEQQWQVIFDIDSGPLAGQQFTGVLEYDQAILETNFTDGLLFAEFGEFDFSVTVPGGATLSLADDPAAIALFGGNELIGLDFLGDNGIEAVNTFDLPNDINNRFNLFLDPDFEPDATGTFSFQRLSETDIVTRAYDSTNADIDDTDILYRPDDPAAADTNFEGDINVSVDLDDGPGSFNPRQVLIRFNDIIGNGPNQIPLGSTIVGAVFRVEIISPGSGFTAHRLLQDWDVDQVTWNSWVDGVDADDVEAVSTPDFGTIGVGGNVLSVDLTPSFQAFAAGAANHGFVLLPVPEGTDGVDFWTSEAPTNVPLLFYPPLLTVALSDGTTLTFQEGQNGFSGTADTTLRAVAPNQNFGSLNTTSIDLNDGGFVSQYLLRFDDIFGTGPGQIDPATNTVVSATLRVRSTSEGEDVSVYELKQPFEETRATWATFDNGIDFDSETGLATNPGEVDLTPVTTISTQFEPTNPNYESLGEDQDFLTFDLTASLQRWAAAPSANLGWAFLPESTNGFDFDAEGTLNPPIGPQLFVSFIPPTSRADFNGDGMVNVSDLLSFLGAYRNQSPNADLNGDGTINVSDLLNFLGLYRQG